MNSTTINHNYYTWNITSGDYHRSYESTERYANKMAIKKRIDRLTRTFLYLGISYSLLIFLVFYLF